MGRSKSVPRRLDKFEYSAIHTETRRNPTKEERRAIWDRMSKKYMRSMGLIGPKQPATWTCTIAGKEIQVAAHTKSEARSAIKKASGLKLPVGLVISKVTV